MAFDQDGPDCGSLSIPPALSIDEVENAAEMIELYWMARLRDFSFSDIANPKDNQLKDLIKDALKDLNEFGKDFKGPKDRNTINVTNATLFKGFTPGDLVGPYLSQFLIKDINFGVFNFEQKLKPIKKGKNYLTTFEDWKSVQDGESREGQVLFDDDTSTEEPQDMRRHFINGRDIARYTQVDALYEAYLNASLILLHMPGLVDSGNPYTDSKNQTGFGTFGNPLILSLLTVM